MNASMRVCSSAPGARSTFGPKTPGTAHHLVHRLHRLEDRVDLVGIEALVAAGRARQIPRVDHEIGRHRSGRWPCSNVCFPIMPSNSAVAIAGSSSAAWTASRAFAQAPAGSSSTDGPRRQLAPDEAEEPLPVVDHVAHDVARHPVVAGRLAVPAVGRHRVDPFGERCGDATETLGDLGHARDCTDHPRNRRQQTCV